MCYVVYFLCLYTQTITCFHSLLVFCANFCFHSREVLFLEFYATVSVHQFFSHFEKSILPRTMKYDVRGQNLELRNKTQCLYINSDSQITSEYVLNLRLYMYITFEAVIQTRYWYYLVEGG